MSQYILEITKGNFITENTNNLKFYEERERERVYVRTRMCACVNKVLPYLPLEIGFVVVNLEAVLEAQTYATILTPELLFCVNLPCSKLHIPCWAWPCPQKDESFLQNVLLSCWHFDSLPG
jgi:hypothetical protein